MSRINSREIKSLKFLFKNGKSDVRIIDYGTTFLKTHRGAIKGKGCLRINKNALSRKESSKIRIERGGSLIVHGNVSFYPKCNIHILEDAVLEIFDGTYFNEGTKISIKNKCTIGKGCAISNDVTIMDSDFHRISDFPKEKGIKIGNHVWLCANCSVLKNVSIDDGAVIGANAVVTKDIPGNSIAVGNPSKIIKSNIVWK